MDALDYWKLCDRITIFQAVMLAIGLDPESKKSWEIERIADKPEGYGAVMTAFLVGARDGVLDAEIHEERDTDMNGNDGGPIDGSVDLERSFVTVQSLKQFLKERGFNTGFFFPREPKGADYLDVENPCYAPKLAAAVEAWTFVTTEKKYETESTPKQLMEKWLRENATRFGLIECVNSSENSDLEART